MNAVSSNFGAIVGIMLVLGSRIMMRAFAFPIANVCPWPNQVRSIGRTANVLRYSPVSFLDGNDGTGEIFEKYDMVPLPDSMVDTTVWVGNLDEFVRDTDLAELFLNKCSSSLLYSVPCAIARRPNNDSLGYGFVTFPTVDDAEVSGNSMYASPRS